jgi:hypothetical protein
MVTVPIRHNLKLAYATSGIIACIMCLASLAGILFGSHIYPAAQVSGNIGTDTLNLILGLPILLGSMWFARRGSLIGLLCWPGVLFYVLYIYTFYVIGLPFNWLFLPYVVLVTLSGYTTIGLVASIDGEAVRQRLHHGAPTRTIAGILILIGILFTVVDGFLIVTALTGHAAVDPTTRTSWIADFTIQLPALLLGGMLLWRREALGYAVAPGLLLQGTVVNAGYALVVVLQAIFSASPMDAPFVGLVFVIGAISCILLALLLRGASGDQVTASFGATKI